MIPTLTNGDISNLGLLGRFSPSILKLLIDFNFYFTYVTWSYVFISNGCLCCALIYPRHDIWGRFKRQFFIRCVQRSNRCYTQKYAERGEQTLPRKHCSDLRRFVFITSTAYSEGPYRGPRLDPRQHSWRPRGLSARGWGREIWTEIADSAWRRAGQWAQLQTSV